MAKTLRDLCVLKGGTGFPEALQGQSDGELPFIKVSDMSLPGNERLITRANNYVDLETASRIGASVFPAASVVFAKVGAALLMNRRRVLTRPTIIDNNMMAAVPEDVNPEFLYHLLCSIDLRGLTQPGALPSVNQTDLGRMRVPDIGPCRQRRIAEILSTVDEAIEQTEALIAKTQQIKTGLMHDLFTRGVTPDGRLRPPRDQAPELYKQSSLGWIPREWRVGRVDDLCSDVVDCPHSTPDYVESGFPCVRTADMLPGQLLIDQTYRVSETTYRERVNRLEPKKGDVIYSREGERLGIASPVGPGKVCLGQRVMLMRPEDSTSPAYLLWVLNTPGFYRRVISGIGATTSPHVNVADVRKQKVTIPKRNEQQIIGSILSGQQGSIECESRFAAGLACLKAGLVSSLLLQGSCGSIDFLPTSRRTVGHES